MGKSCSGFGPGMTSYEMLPKITQALEQAIELGCSTFYLGNYGNFDSLMAQATKKLQEKYPHIERVLVVPYITKELERNKEYYYSSYDALVLPTELLSVPPKFGILKKNEWVIDNSDVIIINSKGAFGGSQRAVEYAQRKKKLIIDVSL